MKKILLTILLGSSVAGFSQTIKDIEVLNKIKDQDLAKVGSILNLKQNKSSNTKLGISTLYFDKGDFYYSARGGSDNVKAVKVGLNIMNKGDGYERWLKICNEFINSKDYQAVSFIHKLPGKETTFGNLNDMLSEMQKLSFGEKDAQLTAFFKKGDDVYKVWAVGLNLVSVSIVDKK